MSKIGSWSTTPGSNNSTPPDGWPEGQAPSTVNDCAREMMAQIRTLINDAQYIDQNFTPTYISATSFSVAGDQTSAIHAGRRLKIFDATAGAATTIYATVATASYTTVTTVSISADAGQLTSSLSSFALAVLSNTNNSLPRNLAASFSAVATANLTVNGTTTASGAVSLLTTLSVSGAVALNSTLTVSGAVAFLSTLSVSGATALNGTVTLSQGVANGVPYFDAGKVLTSGAALRFNGQTLFLSGSTTGTNAALDLTGHAGDYSIYMGNNKFIRWRNNAGVLTTVIGLSSDDNTYINGSAIVVQSLMTISGAATLNSTLSVSGATILKATLNVEGAASLSGAVACGTTLSVSGAAILKSTLSVGGAAIIAGATRLDSTLSVSGNATVVGNLVVGGTLSASGGVAGANIAKAWVMFNGTGTVSIGAQYNVTSITDNGSGDYTVNFTTALADANFAVVMGRGSEAGVFGGILGVRSAGRATTSCRIYVNDAAGSAAQDDPIVSIACFR